MAAKQQPEEKSLVERLRRAAKLFKYIFGPTHHALLLEAADRIEELEREVQQAQRDLATHERIYGVTYRRD